MGEKTAGVGHFAIPTAPAAGTSCTSGAANTFTTNYVQLIASTSAALFITGIYLENAAVSAATYIVIQLATGAAAAETIVGQHLIVMETGSTVTRGYKPIYPPIPVANAARISCKTADSVGTLASLVTLECINQSNVVDDGVAVATVTTVTNQLTGAAIATAVWQDATSGDFTTASSIGKSLYTTGNAPGAASGLQICGSNAATTYATLTSTGAFTVNGVSAVSQMGDSFARIGAAGAGLTALGDARIANLDATVSGRMASYTQPTGFLAATFPATVASTTNITAGTITTTTNLTNAPTAGDLTATMKTSVTTAATAATPTAAAVTGAVGSVTAAITLPTIPTNWIAAAGIAASALNGKGDWNIGKTGYSLTQTFPANFAAAVISASGAVDGNIKSVAGTAVTGSGTAGSPWGPA